MANHRAASDQPPRAASRAAFAAVLLVVLGLGLWALYRFTVGSEGHSFARGAVAPTYFRVSAGETYSIGIPGGVRELARLQQDPATTTCEITPRGGGPSLQLAIVPEGGDTKAVNQIATFVAPQDGRVHIDCTGLPSVYVDDAEGTSGDVSGLWLVLATIALTLGLPLMLSALRGQQRRGPPPEDQADTSAPAAASVSGDEA